MTDDDAKKAGDQLQAHLDAMDARDAAARREATAATLLAALIQARVAGADGVVDADAVPTRFVAKAVALTDALRAELAKGGGK